MEEWTWSDSYIMSVINVDWTFSKIWVEWFGGCRQTCCGWSNTIFDVNLTESGDNSTCIALSHIDLSWIIHKQQVKAAIKATIIKKIKPQAKA